MGRGRARTNAELMELRVPGGEQRVKTYGSLQIADYLIANLQLYPTSKLIDYKTTQLMDY